jgi:pimeloyl-ACP methyl ester carboxylesterase/class 3 adenylate cyclase
VLTTPESVFAVHDGIHIAYQVVGDQGPGLVFVPGSFSMSQAWEDPVYAKGLRQLASFSRLVTFDQRGMGFSDPINPAGIPTIEDLVADLAAVVDAAGVRAPALVGFHDGGAVAAVYAAMHPVSHLVLCNTWPRLRLAPDYPIGFDERVLDNLENLYRERWGDGRIIDMFARPVGQMARDTRKKQRIELASTSPNQSVLLFRMTRELDIRGVLPTISAPTLVIHLEDNVMVPSEHGRYLADAIPGARLVLLPGSDHNFMRNHGAAVFSEVEQFITGSRREAFSDVVLTTMLFTDIVDSTGLAVSLGDVRWGELIGEHNHRVRMLILELHGQEVKNTGDGFLVTFDGPVQAVRCALDAMQSVQDLGIELRAGVHVGEVSRMDSRDLSGLAVHFAQRLCSKATAGQVLTSSTVRDLAAGSDIEFTDQGTTPLKGIPGEWEIFDAR